MSEHCKMKDQLADILPLKGLGAWEVFIAVIIKIMRNTLCPQNKIWSCEFLLVHLSSKTQLILNQRVLENHASRKIVHIKQAPPKQMD